MGDGQEGTSEAAVPVAELADGFDGGDWTLGAWARCHEWAVTTEDDCWGHQPGSTQPERYALYDAAEDDPPIALFSCRHCAESVARALNAYGEVSKVIEGTGVAEHD